MKRIIASILLVMTLLMSMTALTSCFGGGNQTAGEFVMPEGGYTDQKVTITFYHSMGQNLEKVLASAIKNFNKLYPNITVVAKKFDSYDVIHEKLGKEVTTPKGAQASLAICYPDHVSTYNVAGAVQTLDVLINSTATATRADGTTEQIGFTQAQIDDFIEAYWNEGKQFGDGKTYVLPGYKSTELLYYNKTYFDEKGYTVPTTWDEMAALCEQIKADPTADKIIPLGYDSDANFFITLCEQYGSAYTSATGENFQFNNDTNKEFVKMLRTWYENGWLITGDVVGEKSYTSNYFKGTTTSGISSVMCIGSSGGATYQRPNFTTEGNETVYDFEVGVAPIPQVNPDNPKVISQGPSVCIFKKADPYEVLASYLFAKFLATDYSFQGGVSQTNGYVPVIKSIQENENYSQWLAGGTNTANLEAYAARITYAHQDALYTSDVFWGSAEARTQAGLIIKRSLLEKAPNGVDALIDSIFADAINKCKTSIGQK